MSFLELQNVSFKYNKQQVLALKDISLQIENNEVIGLIGHNGSGKTTLTKLLVGALRSFGGKIFLENEDIGCLSLAQVGRKIGYVFQNPDKQLFATTVEAEIRFGLENMGLPSAEIQKRVHYYLSYFNMETYQAVYPLHLSQGQKQRVVLAAIMAMQPQFLILDEPTVGLDGYHREQLKNMLIELKNKDIGMIIISHDLDFLENMAGRFIKLEQGKIVGDIRNGVKHI